MRGSVLESLRVILVTLESTMSENAESADFYFDTLASPADAAPPLGSEALAVIPAETLVGTGTEALEFPARTESRAPIQPCAPQGIEVAPDPSMGPWQRMGHEVVAGVQTLVSAAVYATLIVTFGVQVARVDGLSMAPTLEDHDRLIVNKLVYELGDPRPGDIVMLYYPLNPDKMFVKRVIASEGDVVRIVDGHVYVNDIPLHDDYVPRSEERRVG